VIPNVKERELETQGVTATAVFGISANDSAHIINMLRDTIYTDKVMAVLREYSANAWDAHREVGKADVPIKVTIPTDMDPMLRIQDFGPGLSHTDVFEVFTQYGASTKRNSDSTVGMLGIGCKSGFAYSDSFTVISCHGGKRRTYVAVLDVSEKGIMNLLDEQDCGEETGITIEIAIRKGDIAEFINKAENLYKYYYPRPDINIKLEDITGSQLDLKNGRIFESSQESAWIAVMGCVPYRINTDQLYENGERTVGAYVDEIKGVLYFDIGEVRVNASREELKYDDPTKKAIAAKFAALMDEYVQSTIQNLQAGSFSMWQKRMRAKMMAQLELPLPDDLKDLCKEWVELPPHKSFFMFRRDGSNHIVRITTDSDLRILIRDADCKSLGGYQYNDNDFTVRLADGFTMEEMRKELDEALEQVGLTGVTIRNLNSVPWIQPYDERREEEKKRREEEKKALRALSRAKQGHNKKYSSRVFTLKPDAAFCHPYSQMWEIIPEYEPKEDDVWVVIENFRLRGVDKEENAKFLKALEEDVKICRFFGLRMPTIHAYKNTEKFPIDGKDLVGVPYNKWRVKFFKEAVTQPKIVALIQDLDWVEAWPHRYWSESSRHRPEKMKHYVERACGNLVENLGVRHPITKWAGQVLSSIKRYKNLDESRRNSLDALVERTRAKNFVPNPEKTKKLFYKLYPMLAINQDPGIGILWDSSTGKRDAHIEYVKNMDLLRRLRNKVR
jgi:DNA topoisomerase VI subunit B